MRHFHSFPIFRMKSKLLALGAVAAGLVVAVAAVFPGGSVPSVGETPVAYAAAVDYFLKIEGVEGESKNDKHKNEIEILSWSWGVSNQGTNASGGGGGAGKVSVRDFTFKTMAGKASPKLFSAAVTGQRFPKAVLTTDAGSRPGFYKVTLSDVLVSSYQADGSQGSMPMEQISLNYSKIEFEYVPQGTDGRAAAPVKAGYDVKANKKI